MKAGEQRQNIFSKNLNTLIDNTEAIKGWFKDKMPLVHYNQKGFWEFSHLEWAINIPNEGVFTFTKYKTIKHPSLDNIGHQLRVYTIPINENFPLLMDILEGFINLVTYELIKIGDKEFVMDEQMENWFKNIVKESNDKYRTVEFGEWLRNNNYTRDRLKEDGLWFNDISFNGFFSTERLYDKFIENKKRA